MIPIAEAIAKKTEWVYSFGVGERCEICFCRKTDGHDPDCLFSKWKSGVKEVGESSLVGSLSDK